MTDPRLKAISLHQPYASAMKMGWKTNETRNRPTHYRGDLVICSAQRPLSESDRALVKRCGINVYTNEFGAALCIVEIYACLPTTQFVTSDNTISLRQITPIDYALGDYSSGRFAWLTRNLRVLKKPVPVVGKQGFFYLPVDVSNSIRKQLQ